MDHTLQQTTFDRFFPALAAAHKSPLRQIVKAWGYGRLGRVFDAAAHDLPENFFTTLQNATGLTVEVASGCLSGIPLAGTPTLIVANHPHGPVDGLVLATLVARVRHDFKLMAAGKTAQRLPFAAHYFLPVFNGGKTGVLRRAARQLEDGGALLVFPSGRANRNWQPAQASAQYDPPWRDSVSFLLQNARRSVTVLPVHIDPQKGLLGHWAKALGIGRDIQVLGLAHRLTSPYYVRIGTARTFTPDTDCDRKALTQYLRTQVERLAP